MNPANKEINPDFTKHAPATRWTESRINAWYAKMPWPVGCNYIPQYAINQIEMWQAESFNESIIAKELKWAADLGFNSVRVFLHQLNWEHDQVGFTERIKLFLSIAHRYNIKTMPVLFDGVWNPYPKTGKQPEPRLNVHNSGWVQCPGYEVLNDERKYDLLGSYVRGLVSCFKNDQRILCWDLFNEPDNMNHASYKDDHYSIDKAELSLRLLQRTVDWVREIGPVQPITMAPWQHDWSDPLKLTALDDFMFNHSDIISFHCYEDKHGITKRIQDLLRYKRPILCTEYMARPLNSTFQDILPVLKKHNVGAYNWGFVAGKSQTHCPWSSWEQSMATEPEVWFHDIFKANGEPYDKNEIDYLIQFNRGDEDFAPGDN